MWKTVLHEKHPKSGLTNKDFCGIMEHTKWWRGNAPHRKRGVIVNKDGQGMNRLYNTTTLLARGVSAMPERLSASNNLCLYFL